MKLHFKLTGLIAFSYKAWTFHLIVTHWSDWIWGHETGEDYYSLEYYGLGPLFLLVKENEYKEGDEY